MEDKQDIVLPSTMTEQFREVEQHSPTSSPGGSRSPVVSRQESTDALKPTISFGGNPSIVPTAPFYYIREPPRKSDHTGATNVMALYGLEDFYKSRVSKVGDTLSSFLPNIPGPMNTVGSLDNSSLRSLIDKPPIVGRELLPLSSMQLSGFRLHPSVVSEKYSLMDPVEVPQKKKLEDEPQKQKPDGTPSLLKWTTTSDIAPTVEKKQERKKRQGQVMEREKMKRGPKKKPERKKRQDVAKEREKMTKETTTKTDKHGRVILSGSFYNW